MLKNEYLLCKVNAFFHHEAMDLLHYTDTYSLLNLT